MSKNKATSTPAVELTPAQTVFNEFLARVKSRKSGAQMPLNKNFLAICQGDGVIQKAGNILYNTNLADDSKLADTVRALKALQSSEETDIQVLRKMGWEAMNKSSIQFSVFPDHRGEFPNNGDEIKLRRVEDYVDKETGETKVNLRFVAVKGLEHAPAIASNLIDDLLAELEM